MRGDDRAMPRPRPAPEPNAAQWAGDAEPVSRSEMRLLGRAARGRWDVPDAMRRGSVNRVGAVLDGVESSARERLAAARTLAAFDGSDRADDKLDLEREKAAARHDLERGRLDLDRERLDLMREELAARRPEAGATLADVAREIEA